MMGTQIRPAVPGDLNAIVGVFLRCWEVNYSAVLAPEVLATMTDADARALWARVLEETGFDDVLVATHDEVVLGITRFSLGAGADGYVASLYVSPDAQGLGLGRMLLSAAEAELVDRGAQTATLWVFADNTPSIGFYARCGWAPDGEVRRQPQFGAREIRLAKVLGRS